MNLVLGRGTGVFGPCADEGFIQVVLMFCEAFFLTHTVSPSRLYLRTAHCNPHNRAIREERVQEQCPSEKSTYATIDLYGEHFTKSLQIELIEGEKLNTWAQHWGL